MSLTKKDPSLRVAANDPHLVSLGGGRLSTAVTIHYIPIGDTTIGSSTNCSISLNGTGVRPTHCTIYRSEENELTIVPETDARILIDGTKITHETNLTQGAMITIGNSNYLRFNNPAEAEMMRSAMGSNERISMPQIDFTQPTTTTQQQQRRSNGSSTHDELENDTLHRQSLEIESFYESKINPTKVTSKSGYDNVPIKPIDINGLHCPKVFTADLVTVNMPAKDVLGQKYANFAKNLAENHRSEKNVSNGGGLRNNQVSSSNTSGNYVNIPSTSNFIQNPSGNNSTNSTGSTEFLSKVNNTTPTRSNHGSNVTAYDRYPKPGTYGGLQIFPMNGINTEINNGLKATTTTTSSSANSTPPQRSYDATQNQRSLANLSSLETERLEDMLKICTEYADRQQQLQQQQHAHSNNSSITSSPIVQNRIKTNGSLPREKKSPFYHAHTEQQQNNSSLLQQSYTSSNSTGSNASTKALNGSAISTSSGYENVRLNSQNRVEINGQMTGNSPSVGSPKVGYENMVIGKYVPQSPRTKIRTTCLSPKKEHNYSGNNIFSSAQPPPIKYPKPTKPNEYEQLIKTFEEKLKLEMQAIEESSRYKPPVAAKGSTSAEQAPAKRSNININNLKLQIQQPSSLQNSPKPNKKPAPAPRKLSKSDASSNSSLTHVESTETDVEKLKSTRKELLTCIQKLKNEISELQKQEDEVLRELDLEKALVSAEVHSVGDSLGELDNQLKGLQHKIYRLEAQRNATRVMEENQQAKLKQSIEMKHDQMKKLKELLKQKPNNECLKEELQNVNDTLENERKAFEDLEFQYLEEESEWHAYREELSADEKGLKLKLQEKRMELQHLEKQELSNQNFANSDAKMLRNNLSTLVSELNECQTRVKSIEQSICDITGQLHISSSSDEDEHHGNSPMQSNLVNGVMSQSLFGSAELLCPKRNHVEDIMSKSYNENMFYNNKIELPTTTTAGGAAATSTPKRKQMHVVEINDADAGTESNDPLLRLKYNFDADNKTDGDCERERVKFNLSLGSDDFEVNPLEKRVPSQDDIDRICKVASDAPISTKGATTKIFDSIKEIERNRQLLLAQQGHHVIEHERQKMSNLKKKIHDEARAQYLSMLNSSLDGNKNNSNSSAQKEIQIQELQQLGKQNVDSLMAMNKENQQRNSTEVAKAVNTNEENSSQQRHSQPEFQTAHYLQQQQQQPYKQSQQLQQHTYTHQQQQQQHQQRLSPRPLSEANSELSCDLLNSTTHTSAGISADNTCKSSIELSTTNTSGFGSGQRYSAEPNDDDAATKRSSVNSNDTTSGNSGGSGGSGGGHNTNERKRQLPKHQRPLTRYLPIFSPDLNLRHHIESAGHQIALCPHIIVDAYSCRGYLHKLGATFHGWARRWFVLDRQRNAFMYFSDKSERKPRGGAYFSTIDEVYLDHLNASKSGRPHCTFIVKTKKRSYHLQAASDAAARIWIDAIITGAQGNLDY